MSQPLATAVSAPLIAVNLLAAEVWVGSLVALAVVTRAADETLDASTRQLEGADRHGMSSLKKDARRATLPRGAIAVSTVAAVANVAVYLAHN